MIIVIICFSRDKNACHELHNWQMLGSRTRLDKGSDPPELVNHHDLWSIYKLWPFFVPQDPFINCWTEQYQNEYIYSSLFFMPKTNIYWNTAVTSLESRLGYNLILNALKYTKMIVYHDTRSMKLNIDQNFMKRFRWECSECGT